MNVLITGGYGFLGSRIALYLYKKNFNLIILDKKIDKKKKTFIKKD